MPNVCSRRAPNLLHLSLPGLLNVLSGVLQANTVNVHHHSVVSSDGVEDAPDERDGLEGHTDADDQADGEDNMGEDSGNLTGRKKKLFEVRLKMVIANMMFSLSFEKAMPLFCQLLYLLFHFLVVFCPL